MKAPLEDDIRNACNDIADMLVLKNKKYGNSALNPVRIFSRADTVEQLKVRIDDKLSRTARKPDNLIEDEDLVGDMIGYFILLKIALEREEV